MFGVKKYEKCESVWCHECSQIDSCAEFAKAKSEQDEYINLVNEEIESGIRCEKCSVMYDDYGLCDCVPEY